MLRKVSHLGKTHKSIFQCIMSNGHSGGGGFGINLKSIFFLVMIIEGWISIKNGVNIVGNTLFFQLET